MNQKGLITWDRKRKDAYYLYKANWNPEPMVYIASRDWQVRGGERGEKSTIDVYSNGSSVSLQVNGASLQTQNVNDLKRATFQVNLRDGANQLTATSKINGKTVIDNLTILYKAYDPQLKEFSGSLSINAGSNAQYTDPSGNVWIEDRPYAAGGFGYTGGHFKVFDRKDVIKNTDHEPMMYSYLDSLSGYRFDVPDGKYQVTLYLAEPAKLNKGDRVFSVSINNEEVISRLDLTEQYGFATTVVKTIVVNAKNGAGVQVQFSSVKGNAVLSGIQLEKVF